MKAVELEGLSKVFMPAWSGAPFHALRGVNLSIAEGEIVGLLGPNGSGKTTLLKIVMGLVSPTAGNCLVFGRPSRHAEVRSLVAYLPDAPEFYPYLTGRELLRFFARLAGLCGRSREERIEEVISLVGMEAASSRRVGGYSRGMKQRIGVAQALIANPRLAILDEPLANLDPEGASDIGDILHGIRARGGTVLVSSHQLDQMEDLCTRVVLLNRGRLVASGAVDELVPSRRDNILVVESLAETDESELRVWLENRGAHLRSAPLGKAGELEKVYLAAVDRCRSTGRGF